MSNNKSRGLERKAGGWKVFSISAPAEGSHQNGAIPLYLMAALRECVEKNLISQRTIESNELLGAFLIRLTKRPSIGIEFGLDSREIDELVSLWKRLTKNGTIPPVEVLVGPPPSLRGARFVDDLHRKIAMRIMKDTGYIR